MTNDPPESARAIPAMPLLSDEPIRSIDHDKLSRDRLVNVIAQHLLAPTPSESVVIALHAPWGAGKSSFLNLIEQRLTNNAPDGHLASVQPRVVRFNPWHFGNVETLVRMFFEELARTIGKRNETGRKIGKRMNTYGQLLSKTTSAIPITTVKIGGKLLGSVMTAVGTNLTSKKSLGETRADLEKLLECLDFRIVIFVDDIDRLEPDVTKLLFRMIRLNANLPNITYVLAFDRQVVERNLNGEHDHFGRAYLEKIVQVSFDMPNPDPEIVRRLLYGHIHTLLQSHPLEKDRFTTVRSLGFDVHFRTLRDVKRYANGLRLTLPLVAREVDVVDFLVIELIRLFHPGIYQEIARMKDVLAFHPMMGYVDFRAENIKKQTDRLCCMASGLKESMRNLLLELFPVVEGAYKNVSAVDPPVPNITKRRVCHQEYFDRYFLLPIPAGRMSEAEMEMFVERLEDREKTEKRLRQAIEAGKAPDLIERLPEHVSKMPETCVAPLIALMLYFGDDLQFEPRHHYDLGGSYYVRLAVLQSLNRLTEKKRLEIIRGMTKKAKSLGTLVRVITALRETMSRTEWEAIRDEALERIRSENDDGTLWRQQQLSEILIRWHTWADKDEVRAAVSKYIEDDSHLLCFMRKFVRKSLDWEETAEPYIIGNYLKTILGETAEADMRGKLRSIESRYEDDSDSAREAREILGMPWEY